MPRMLHLTENLSKGLRRKGIKGVWLPGVASLPKHFQGSGKRLSCCPSVTIRSCGSPSRGCPRGSGPFRSGLLASGGRCRSAAGSTIAAGRNSGIARGRLCPPAGLPGFNQCIKDSSNHRFSKTEEDIM
eukprot:2089465-Amphidinium_carterae.2